MNKAEFSHIMGQESQAPHQPVMVNEVLEYLAPKPGQIVADATAGAGGHSVTIVPRLLPDGKFIALDQDRTALELVNRRLLEFSDITHTIHSNFRELPNVLKELGVAGLDGLLMDLGMSSMQVDTAGRGFSFMQEGPLDMRMDNTQSLTAEEIVNSWSFEDLRDTIKTLGEERYAVTYARAIEKYRAKETITSTDQLAELIKKATPPKARYGRLHPATRTFQALRMAVNDELGALEEVLKVLPRVMRPYGRVVCISFHSMEDRLVKHAFAEGQREKRWTVLTKKPVLPTEQEISVNARSRSAKLRAMLNTPPEPKKSRRYSGRKPQAEDLD